MVEGMLAGCCDVSSYGYGVWPRVTDSSMEESE